MPQTFGANIHNLLSNAFFMKDGVKGAFAEDKMVNRGLNVLQDVISSMKQDQLTENGKKYPIQYSMLAILLSEKS